VRLPIEGNKSVSIGSQNTIIGDYSGALGYGNTVQGNRSFAFGYRAHVTNDNAFVWTAPQAGGSTGNSHGEGSFSIYPKNGAYGFYIGNKSLWEYLDARRDKADNIAYSATTVGEWHWVPATNGWSIVWDEYFPGMGEWKLKRTNQNFLDPIFDVSGRQKNIDATELQFTDGGVSYTASRDLSYIATPGESFVTPTYVLSQINTLSNKLNDADKDYKYPMFIIDLNPNGSNKWFHVELKATTNNFGTAGIEGMTFFCATSVNGDYSLYQGVYPDWCKLFVLDSNADSDVRRWKAISNTADLALNNKSTGTLVIIVDPELLQRAQGTDWLYEGNDELIWSYVRIGHFEPEKTSDNKQRWRAIMPVRWYRQLPSWTNQGVTP
jgi:hypothetical protein